MENLSLGHILLVIIVAILVYGERLPQAARKVGVKYAELKRKWQDMQVNIKREIDNAVSEADIKKDVKEAVSDVNMDKLLSENQKEPDKGTTPSS